MAELLKAEGITKSYRMGKIILPVLRGINLSVGEGSVMVIAGPSGAGKSTLLHILGGLDPPDGGKVWLESKEVYQLSNRARSRVRNQKVGFVFQFFHLLPEFTAWENVMLPVLIRGGGGFWLRRKLKKIAAENLALVDLSQRLDHYPAQLSGGEQQRVAVARALVNRPRLLLADEPTGNLDSQSGQNLLDLLLRLNREQGQTIIVVSHDREVAEWAPRVVYIRDGLLQEG